MKTLKPSHFLRQSDFETAPIQDGKERVPKIPVFFEDEVVTWATNGFEHGYRYKLTDEFKAAHPSLSFEGLFDVHGLMAAILLIDNDTKDQPSN